MNRGFTLVELSISIAIIAIIFSIGIPVYVSMIGRNDVDVLADQATEFAHRAQVFSRANKNNGTWGISVNSSSIILFQGSSYLTRNSMYDESLDIAPTIIATSTAEFVFQTYSGIPNASGTISFSNSQNKSRVITINSGGGIE